MKINKKKRGGLSATLVGVTSLALFITFFIAIILSLRGCDGRIAEVPFEELKSAIQRVQKVDGATETIEIFIGPDSMIIGYAPESQNIITKYEANLVGNIRPVSRAWYDFSIGASYTFPRENGELEGTLQNLGNPNFIGYVKQRPPDCPPNAFCFCDCFNFNLRTDDRAYFKSENAYITCGREQCISIMNVSMQNKIYLKDFLTYSNKYNKIEDDEDYEKLFPQPHTVHWEGGFIMPRTMRVELGSVTQQVCRDRITRAYYYRLKPCKNYGTHRDILIFNQRLMLAGHLENYMADFFNLRIKNEGAGRISFEVI